MRKKIKILIPVIIILLLLAGWRFRAGRTGGMARGRMRSAAVAVETAPIRRGMIADTRVFTGTLVSRARYVVAPKVAGRLEELSVNIGDALVPGQLLFRIDDEEYIQQVAQSRAILDVARATVEQQSTAMALAEREMNRVRSLREKRIAAEAEWDKAESEHQTQIARHRVALAQMAEKESSLRSSEVRLSYTRIDAPEEIMTNRWFVEERYVEAGTMLAANTPVLAVVDLAELTAVINVIESDYPLMRVGMPVVIETDAYPQTNFPGTVARLAPALREATRQARVEITVPNGAHLLRPGMFVRARIEFGRRADAVLIPRSALVHQQAVEGVFLIDHEALVARFVPVTIGIQTPDVVEIAAPELTGQAATLGRHLLSDGTAVILPEPFGSAPEKPGVERKGRR